LKYHPDKCVDESLKEENTFKFKLIGKIYSILSDDEKKKVYDETGLFDDDSELDGNCNWDVYFKKMFKKVKEEDIVEFFKSYRGTDQERSDLFDLYEKHKGI
jgi:DnaJ homolog subfamily C member 9